MPTESTSVITIRSDPWYSRGTYSLLSLSPCGSAGPSGLGLAPSSLHYFQAVLLFLSFPFSLFLIFALSPYLSSFVARLSSSVVDPVFSLSPSCSVYLLYPPFRPPPFLRPRLSSFSRDFPLKPWAHVSSSFVPRSLRRASRAEKSREVTPLTHATGQGRRGKAGEPAEGACETVGSASGGTPVCLPVRPRPRLSERHRRCRAACTR